MHNQHIVSHLVWLRLRRDLLGAAFNELEKCRMTVPDAEMESVLGARENVIKELDAIRESIFSCKLALTLDSMS